MRDVWAAQAPALPCWLSACVENHKQHHWACYRKDTCLADTRERDPSEKSLICLEVWSPFDTPAGIVCLCFSTCTQSHVKLGPVWLIRKVRIEMQDDCQKTASLPILSCKCNITQSLLLRSGKLKQITFLVSQFSLFGLNKKTGPGRRVPFSSEWTSNNIWCWFMWEEVLTLVWATNGFESQCPMLWRVWRQKFIAAELAAPRKLKGSGNFRLLFPSQD